MPDAAADQIEHWADAIEAAIAGSRWFDRVRVLRETGSTQDAARAAGGGRPGVIVVAGRQTTGRGRQGRAWLQRGDLGVAATFVVGLEADAGASRRMSMVAGLAALDACRACGATGAGIKAPNDVVVLDAGVASGHRKLAGVLVEQRDGLACVGIGINVLQGSGDFDEPIRETATSLAMLGAEAARIDVLCALVRSMDEWMSADTGDMERAWSGGVVGGGASSSASSVRPGSA
ncbi:MAG: biotin--[acetyl-CoA-carboxylase] ligase [Phycisphaerales bacterium]|nr:biotin--[acetyl-CoA-carboxylase] ligase [Phycisphaerales bacterium]